MDNSVSLRCHPAPATQEVTSRSHIETLTHHDSAAAIQISSRGPLLVGAQLLRQCAHVGEPPSHRTLFRQCTCATVTRCSAQVRARPHTGCRDQPWRLHERLWLHAEDEPHPGDGTRRIAFLLLFSMKVCTGSDFASVLCMPCRDCACTARRIHPRCECISAIADRSRHRRAQTDRKNSLVGMLAEA